MTASKGVKVASFGLVVFALSLAQFIMTVDTTIMNVSVPTLVEDLNTTVGAVQAAITLYALVMASFMLIGSKLGEIYGRKKIFQIGLVIYAIGSAITAIAPNIMVLILGWSILEGIGASLMMPAMMALISVNFKGASRVKALGIVAGVAGAAAAVGPIIGGALSTYATWRYAFVGEVIIAIFALILSRKILDAKVVDNVKMDYKGAVLIASGLGIFVYGVLQAGTYGWIRAIKPLEFAGQSFELLGFSIVPFICGLGVFLVWRFMVHEKLQLHSNKPYLLNVNLLKIISLRSGLSVVLISQMVLGGTLFIMPLFLQLALGYDAMQTGVALLPVSVGLILLSVVGAKVTKKFTTIDSVRIGQFILLAGLIALFMVVGSDTTAKDLIIPFTLIGAGIGLIIPFIQTIVLGSVKDKDSTQAAGLNYTYQQLGMSLGTAVIGSVLIFALGNGLVQGLSNSASFDQAMVEQNSVQISSGVEYASDEQVEAALQQTDINEAQQADLLQANEDARVQAIKASVAVAALFSLLAIGASGRIKDSLDIKDHKAVATEQ